MDGDAGTPKSEVRVQRALELIERAQHDLEAAAAELSPIAGGAAMRRRTLALATKAHDLWRKLAYGNRSRWRLDSEGEDIP
jgi:hypothetical protein